MLVQGIHADIMAHARAKMMVLFARVNRVPMVTHVRVVSTHFIYIALEITRNVLISSVCY